MALWRPARAKSRRTGRRRGSTPRAWAYSFYARQVRPLRLPLNRLSSNGEAFTAPASALGVRIVEDEAGGEVVLLPVHGRPDQVEQRRSVDEKASARRFDP